MLRTYSGHSTKLRDILVLNGGITLHADGILKTQQLVALSTSFSKSTREFVMRPEYLKERLNKGNPSERGARYAR